jgi:hypothetical protein
MTFIIWGVSTVMTVKKRKPLVAAPVGARRLRRPDSSLRELSPLVKGQES